MHTLITWEIFNSVYYEEYFPASIRNTKELEFVRLQERNMSISKYATKLEALYKFSTIHQCNLDEVWKCIKSKGGLREDILASVELMEIQGLCNPCKQVQTSRRVQ